MAHRAPLSFNLETAVSARGRRPLADTGARAGRPLLVRDDLSEATRSYAVVLVNWLFKALNCGTFDRARPSCLVRLLRLLSPALRAVVVVQAYVYLFRGMYTEPPLTFAHQLKHAFPWCVFLCYVVMYALFYVSMLSGRFGAKEERSATPALFLQLPFILFTRAQFGFDTAWGLWRAVVASIFYTVTLAVVLVTTHSLMSHMETARNTACAALFAIQAVTSVITALADSTEIGGHFGVHTQDVVAGVALAWRVVVSIVPVLPLTVGFFVFCFPTYNVAPRL